MTLDMRTVLNIEGFLFFLNFVVLLILWIQVRNRFNGVGLWTAFFFFSAACSLVVGFQDYMPAWVSIPFANSLVAGGFILLFLGSLRFIGRKIPLWVTVFSLITFAAFIFIHTFYTFAEPDLTKRIFNVSIFIAFYAFLTLVIFSWPVNRQILSYSRGTRIALLIIVLTLAVRLLGVAQIETNDRMASGLYDISTILAFCISVVFLAFTLVLMVNKRNLTFFSESELNFRNTIDNSPVAIHITDSQSRTVYGNEGLLKLYGYKSIEEFNEHPIEQRYTSESAEKLKKLQQLFSEDKESPEKYELDIIRQDGSIRNIEVYHKNIIWNGTRHRQNTLIDITEKKQVEEEIIRRNRELESFGTQVPGMLYIFRIDPEGKFTLPYSNAAIQDIFGCTPEDAREDISPVLQAFHADDYQRIMDSIAASQQNLTPWEIEFRVQIPGSSDVKTIWGRSAPELQQNGDILWYGFLTDITDQRTAEKEVAVQAQLLDQATDSICLLDRQGKLVYINNTFAKIRGYSKEELLGKSMNDLRHTMTPEILEDINRQLAENGRAVFETTHFHKDGTPLIFEVHSQVMNVEGEAYSLNIERDISERKQMEKEVIESEENFRNSIDNSPLGIIISGGFGKPVYANKGALELFGYKDLDEFFNAPIDMRYRPEDIERIRSRMERLLSKVTKIEKDRYTIKRTDGQLRFIEVVASNTLWDNQNCVMSAFQDITERQQAEEREKLLQQELITQNRLATVGEMAAGIAHEINNPLTGVVGFSSLLMEQNLPENIKQEIQIINEGAERVASIVSRMLSFARKQDLTFGFDNVNDIIETVLNIQSYDMQLNNIKAVRNLQSDLPLVQMDSGQIQQVFLNIIINAVIEMRKVHQEGNLTITTERFDDMVRVSFEDDGPGIKQENLSRIFDPFFTTREVGEGTGLGLSVSYRIIANHHGNIYAESEYGKGARFIVELPIKQTEKSDERPETEDKEKVLRTGKILVVDDEDIVRKLLKQILESAGYEVEVIESSEDALNIIGETDFDVCLLDIRMPKITGIDLYEKLLNTSPGLAEKVVFVTGDVMSEETMVYMLSAEIPHVRKPFTATEILDAISKVMS